MAIIIGAATTVGGDFSGAISAQWGVNQQITRLWQLGSWTQYDYQIVDIETASLTVYAGGGPTKSLTPATTCTDSQATASVVISPQNCGGGSITGVNNTFYIMSYSYSKGDAVGLGQQSYSLQRWPGSAVDKHVQAPDFVLQGIAEGSEGADSGLSTGVTLESIDATGSQGNVSAGFPGIGQVTTVNFGIVSTISNGDLRSAGKTGQSQASIAHQPLYL